MKKANKENKKKKQNKIKEQINLEIQDIFNRFKCKPPHLNYDHIKERLEVLKLMKEIISD